MGTKTIGLDEEAYEKLRAEKRDGESFSDTVKRITDEVSSDWRRSFGKYAGPDADEFEEAVLESRRRTSRGLARRQREVNEMMDAAFGADDENAVADGADEANAPADGDDDTGAVDDDAERIGDEP